MSKVRSLIICRTPQSAEIAAKSLAITFKEKGIDSKFLNRKTLEVEKDIYYFRDPNDLMGVLADKIALQGADLLTVEEMQKIILRAASRETLIYINNINN